MEEQNKTGEEAAGQDTKFYLMVAGLLTLICVTMAGLWLMERGHRGRAEDEVQKMAEYLQDNKKKINTLGQMLVQQSQVLAVQRGELATRQAKLDGRDQTVLLMSASVGEKLGLLPGDIVEVTRPPATTQPVKSATPAK